MKLFVGKQSSLYNLDPFRSSDHDPVIVGLNLNTVPVAGNDTAVTDENTAVDINVLVNDRDTISDFNSQAGDRIVLNNLPTHTFNAGIIIADNLNAVAAVYNDVDPNVAGSQSLATNQAVFFSFGRSAATQRTYLSINDNTAAFNANSDLLIEVTSLFGTLPTGSLTTSNYFTV